MSIHKSLNIQGTLNTERSVWTRRERIEKLKEEGRWDEESDSPFGLPKVRTRFKVLGKKKKVAEDDAATDAAVLAEGEEGAEAAAETPEEGDEGADSDAS